VFAHAGVIIRPIEERDLPAMVELRADPAVWRHLGSIEMVGLERQRDWFKSLHHRSDRRYYILCTDAVDCVGIVRTDEIDPVNRSIRIGGDVLPKYQGQGYGGRMYKLLLKYCFDYLNVQRVWLLVMENNTVAMNLYRKAGFVEEGRQRKAIFRDGAYFDYVMMSILHSEYEKGADR
jgi:UDP-4-amino-4,6-dideoxy-N-acetyl-beta-L-altrosamine N-acetyltransferase